MAYLSSNLRIIQNRGDGSSPQTWSYQSTDALSLVRSTGYFADADNRGMRVGDVVIYSETDNGFSSTTLVVSSIVARAASVGAAGGLAVTAGVGITGAVGGVYKASVTRVDDVILTRIMIDLTGLNSGGTAGDVIGTNGAGAAHLGQITTARNGVIFGVRMTCLEVPAGGDTDFDLYSASVATGVEDTAISAISGVQVINAGVQALGTATAAGDLTADHYLYLVGQGTANATYTAGRVLIELFGA